MPAPPLQIQTVYAELLERAASDAFHNAFAAEGNFVRKAIKGKGYWYFQQTTPEGRVQKYVGPETQALLAQIATHRQERNDFQERRSLVSTLVRSFGCPRPQNEIGEIIAALATAGVFRLRSVLVGTSAFQTYGAMLGVPLRSTVLRTGDVDIAQFRNISVAVEDRVPPPLEILRSLDSSFRAVPHQVDGRKVSRYQSSSGLRLDFLSPADGSAKSGLQHLPALRTDAEPLQFLDFLIHDPEPAVILHDAGIYVLVPSPQRFAVHKLIVSRRRRTGDPKRDKDLHQAALLLDILLKKRSRELRDAWQEARGRDATWARLLIEALESLPVSTRDACLKLFGQLRQDMPDFDLHFENSTARYDADRDVVMFEGVETTGSRVACAISLEALEDHFEADGLAPKERVAKFRANRSRIETMAGKKYLSWPVEMPGAVLIKTEDVAKLAR